jgi:penicillin-binding protein 2
MQTLESSKHEGWLSWFLRGLAILGFLILLARLIDLQIIRGSYFRVLAEGNRIRRVPIVAPRGKILARGGEVLVGNRQVKKRVIFDPESGYEKLDNIEGASEDELIEESARDYPLGAAFGHVSGYLGETAQEEVGKIMAQCPEKGPRKLGSLVGRTGLEEEYNCTLTGIDGEELVEVDATGKKVRVLGRKEPTPGEDIKTSIDYNLQEKTAELLGGAKGAIVVSDARGEILALYSSPSFDPNMFIDKTRQVQVTSYLDDANLPLFDRAVSGIFHPGSIFKPIVAIAALSESVIDKTYTYTDPGVISVGGSSYTNWYFTQYGRTEGTIDLPRAITRSTDTFFYKLGEMVGVEKLAEWANKFNLGEKTGIDLPGEIAGLIPSPAWKVKVRGERWFLGNTYHMAIGQGDIAVTPIGINSAIAAIAAGGTYCSPHIVVAEGSGNSQIPISNLQCWGLGIGKETISLVKEGMKGACLPGGTGFTFFDFEGKEGVGVACKTGTAQTESGDPHAWFSVFAPVDPPAGGPQIVATVLVENGGEGAYVAGPIARDIFDYWFTRN